MGIEIRVVTKDGTETVSTQLPFDFDACAGARSITLRSGDQTFTVEAPMLFGFNAPLFLITGAKKNSVFVGKKLDDGRIKQAQLAADGEMDVRTVDGALWPPAVLINTALGEPS